MSGCLVPSLAFTSSSSTLTLTLVPLPSLSNSTPSNLLPLPITARSYLRPPRFSRHIRAMEAIAAEHSGATDNQGVSTPLMKLLFVEMGVGYDQHGSVFCCYHFLLFSQKVSKFELKLGAIATAKTLRRLQCARVEMPYLPIQFPPFEEVFFQVQTLFRHQAPGTRHPPFVRLLLICCTVRLEYD